MQYPSIYVPLYFLPSLFGTRQLDRTKFSAYVFAYLLQNSLSMQRMCLDGRFSFANAKKVISHSAYTTSEMLTRSMLSILEHSYALRLQKVWLLLRNQLLAMRFSLIVCAKSASKPDSSNVCSHKSSAALEWPCACVFGVWKMKFGAKIKATCLSWNDFAHNSCFDGKSQFMKSGSSKGKLLKSTKWNA